MPQYAPQTPKRIIPLESERRVVVRTPSGCEIYRKIVRKGREVLKFVRFQPA